MDQETLENQRRWEIHKDADGLLHQRMAAFLTFEGFLLSAHFIILLNISNEKIYLVYAICIIVSGIVTSILFLGSLTRITAGIKILKREIIDNDKVYARYYGTTHAIRYPFSVGFPVTILTLWILLGGLLSIKSGYVSLGWPRDQTNARVQDAPLENKTGKIGADDDNHRKGKHRASRRKHSA